MSMSTKTQPSFNAEYTLPGVLHFLQVEWRRFEKDRNEWEIEKAAMKARIALLEGERRGIENIKADLMRRVKMLEFALRKERNKYVELNSTGKSPIERLAYSEKEAAPSGPSTLPKTKNEASNGDTKASLTQSFSSPSLYSHFNTTGNTKSKAKSRDILKSCLQEVTYLSDISSTPNPVVESVPKQDERPRQTSTQDSHKPASPQPAPVENITILTRPRSQSETSILKPDPALFSDSRPRASKEAPEKIDPPAEKQGPSPESMAIAMRLLQSLEEVNPRPKDADADEKKKRRITVLAPPTYNGDPLDTLEKRDDDDDHGIQTREKFANRKSICQEVDPEEEEKLIQEIQSQYNISSEKLTNMMQKYDSKSKAEGADTLNELSSLTWSLDDNEASTNEGAAEAKKSDERLWKPKMALRSHLDTIRSIDFHTRDPVLASGSEDGIVKMWRFRKNTGKKTQECEPYINFRGHVSAVTAVVIDSKADRCYSSSLDSTIRIWSLPSPSRDLYSYNESALCYHVLVGHSDSVWDVKLLPGQNSHKIASASADGTVKIWDVEHRLTILQSSIGYDGVNVGGDSILMDEYSTNPTSIEFSHSEPNKLMVAYQNSIIRLFDIETGQPVLNFNSDATYDSTSATQINKIVAHPTLPLVISAHEDRYIRFFDINTGQCIHSMIAHLDSVSALDINHTGLQLVSGGHDSSIRIWDTTMYKCLQEFSSHRRKSDEGVCSVRYHQSLPWLASGGADSVVKIYGPPS
ncbi:WD40 repeat-like protein [Basidiobolus meristosporus CBS 931.73]|uniref:WD40 repeat-like protein n=1 Tax=Basidiobolus meristosporus CBS 931.73 TaxID=1314790 RepID=A0A1Y1YUJ9_9FUNG|nr:WD40 repeat-like protein [Basidiobolus meristosporus CBS 931.73]|eukprot:ORY01712.1 WD40 repeat-like protein [Basidiobolus meristosporus CBS 931.73]